MKATVKTMAAAGSLIAAGSASASFINISVDEFVGEGWLENGYGDTGLTTYRMYANFTGEDNDGVLATFGVGGFPLSLNSTGGYHNADRFAGNTAPVDVTSLGIWDNQWDTYVTIGRTSDEDDFTDTTPGFGTLTNDLSVDWVTENGGWLATPDRPQTFADENNQVILAQFVSPAGDRTAVFSGTISLLLFNLDREELIAYSSPAPGALALLGLAALGATRRRASGPL